MCTNDLFLNIQNIQKMCIFRNILWPLRSKLLRILIQLIKKIWLNCNSLRNKSAKAYYIFLKGSIILHLLEFKKNKICHFHVKFFFIYISIWYLSFFSLSIYKSTKMLFSASIFNLIGLKIYLTLLLLIFINNFCATVLNL